MSDQYIGEIRMFAGNYAPAGWKICDGSTLSIAEYPELFSLIGTLYGGDGQTTFGIPDFRGRIPVHYSTTIPLGTKSGTETVILTSSQIPAHTHLANANNDQESAVESSPINHFWGVSDFTNYTNQSPDTTMSPVSIQPSGGNQPHDNMMPSLAINFIIAVAGLYPSQY